MNRRKTLFFIVATFYVYIAFSTHTYASPNPGDKKVVEITWARTTESEGAIVLPVASWKWSDVKNINYNKTDDVWDGGTIGSSYIKDASRSWDIATWHTKRSYWNGTSDVRRFHGEFTIPDGYDVFDYVMISSVGNYETLGLHEIIAINDNIYIFIYPKGEEINDENFLEHLAFWTGTACQEAAKVVNNGNPITFHGILGTEPWDYKKIIGEPIPKENLLSHTDGWYCEASKNNIGYIMKNYPNATEFVIELIVEDYAEDGGMDRLDLTFTKVLGESTGGIDMGVSEDKEPDEETIENETQESTPAGVSEVTPGITSEVTPEVTSEATPEGIMTEEEIFQLGGADTEIPQTNALEDINGNEAVPKTGIRSIMPYIISFIIATVGICFLFRKRKKIWAGKGGQKRF